MGEFRAAGCSERRHGSRADHERYG